MVNVETFREKTRGMPQLIFGKDSHTDYFTTDCLKNDDREVALLNMLPTTAIVQTEETLMRGIDYSTTHPEGIALLIAKSCSSTRAYHQALGRVGRYGAKCKRFILEETVPVDIEKERDFAIRLAAMGIAN